MSISSIVGGIKAIVPAVIGIAIALAAMTVWGWYNDSTALALLVPKHASLEQQHGEKVAQIAVLKEEIAELKAVASELQAGIAEQNHALALAEERARSAEAQQAMAKANAEQLARQKDRRIATLQQALDDATQTVSDLLDKSWELHSHVF